MTRGRYLVNEFILFQNLLSTIIRQRNDVTIFMCANTVNKYACPYFTEMGLHRVKEMKQGEIDVYTYGDSGLLVAVEFSDSPSKSKPSDVYFAFNNPRLQMITGKGNVWEMDIYPHCPTKYAPRDVLFTFFILFDSEILQGEIVLKDELYFLFIHRKTTPLKDEANDLIYSQEYNARPNYRRNILSRSYKSRVKLPTSLGRTKYFTKITRSERLCVIISNGVKQTKRKNTLHVCGGYLIFPRAWKIVSRETLQDNSLF